MPFVRKPVSAPTLEDRLAGHAATKAAAMSVFEQAATDLDEVRDSAYALSNEIGDEIIRLDEISAAAEAEAADAEIKASKIRALFV